MFHVSFYVDPQRCFVLHTESIKCMQVLHAWTMWNLRDDSYRFGSCKHIDTKIGLSSNHFLPPLLITSYRRFKINLSTWLTNRYFNRAFCLWAKKLAVDSGIMWQKAETCKITTEILKLVHPKISFADKQQFQQAAVLCVLPRLRENPLGSQIVNQNFITDKVHPPGPNWTRHELGHADFLYIFHSSPHHRKGLLHLQVLHEWNFWYWRSWNMFEAWSQHMGHQPWSLPGISLSRCCLCWWSPLHIKHLLIISLYRYWPFRSVCQLTNGNCCYFERPGHTSFISSFICMGFTVRDDEILLTGDVYIIGVTVWIPEQMILKWCHKLSPKVPYSHCSVAEG